jgi:hypothetical protein
MPTEKARGSDIWPAGTRRKTALRVAVSSDTRRHRTGEPANDLLENGRFGLHRR